MCITSVDFAVKLAGNCSLGQALLSQAKETGYMIDKVVRKVIGVVPLWLYSRISPTPKIRLNRE